MVRSLIGVETTTQGDAVDAPKTPRANAEGAPSAVLITGL
jgi:hypothetical protein